MTWPSHTGSTWRRSKPRPLVVSVCVHVSIDWSVNHRHEFWFYLCHWLWAGYSSFCIPGALEIWNGAKSCWLHILSEHKASSCLEKVQHMQKAWQLSRITTTIFAHPFWVSQPLKLKGRTGSWPGFFFCLQITCSYKSKQSCAAKTVWLQRMRFVWWHMIQLF